MRKATDDIKYKKEVEEICKSMEGRIMQLCERFRTDDYNEATIYVFWIGVQGDIDEGLKKARRRKND